jgi:hypothetical protein
MKVRGPLRTAVTAVLATALLVGLAVAACGCGDGGSLVGTWSSAEQGETLEFRSDGTVVLTMEDGQVATLTYEAKGTGLILGVEGGGTRTLGYAIKDGVLTLTYPEEDAVEYKRVK